MVLNEELLKQHVVTVTTPIRRLEIAKAFEALTSEEALYAHFFAEASWKGAKSCLDQASSESPQIMQLLLGMFRACGGEDPKQSVQRFIKMAKQTIAPAEVDAFMAYAAVFLGNMGNYHSFGDSKFIPDLPTESFAKLVQSAAAGEDVKPDAAAKLLELWEKVGEKIYSLKDGEREFGFSPAGCSAYYSPGMTQSEAQAITDWQRSKGLGVENTRVFKRAGSGAPGELPTYEIRVASAEGRCGEEELVEGQFKVVVVYGDYQSAMAEVADHLTRAIEVAANDVQKDMLREYIRHFKTGDLKAHIESQRLWVKDKGPVVETNIGFIETYRDPLGQRAEFEGLVAVVNKEMSAKFGALVAAAPQLLDKMPWTKEFEKDIFLRPDFTSLEVLAFAGSGVPAGINIPNYNEIRQDEGFKNVSLGNVLSAREGDEPISFISSGDVEMYRKLKGPAFEVQVGTHELLGHGSGKLFQQNQDGSYNFDRSTVNPLTGQPVATWYKPGETWDSKFGQISSSFEECRAECTGCFMSADPQVLEIFGHTGSGADDIMYINWLHMARAGLLALEYYSPDTKAWRQAHMQARYAILRTMLAASAQDASPGQPFLEIKQSKTPAPAASVAAAAAGEAPVMVDDLELAMNRDKLKCIGVPAVADLLKRLNLYKAVADAEGGTAMFKSLTSVDEEWLKRRQIVLNRKQPRPLFVQAHTALDAATGKVTVTEFEATHAGMVESFLTRY